MGFSNVGVGYHRSWYPGLNANGENSYSYVNPHRNYHPIKSSHVRKWILWTFLLSCLVIFITLLTVAIWTGTFSPQQIDSIGLTQFENEFINYNNSRGLVYNITDDDDTDEFSMTPKFSNRDITLDVNSTEDKDDYLIVNSPEFSFKKLGYVSTNKPINEYSSTPKINLEKESYSTTETYIGYSTTTIEIKTDKLTYSSSAEARKENSNTTPEIDNEKISHSSSIDDLEVNDETTVTNIEIITASPSSKASNSAKISTQETSLSSHAHVDISRVSQDQLELGVCKKKTPFKCILKNKSMEESCISMSRVCDGIEDCLGNIDELNCIRLASNRSHIEDEEDDLLEKSGIVLIRFQGVWHPYCSHTWTSFIFTKLCSLLHPLFRFATGHTISLAQHDTDIKSPFSLLFLQNETKVTLETEQYGLVAKKMNYSRDQDLAKCKIAYLKCSKIFK